MKTEIIQMEGERLRCSQMERRYGKIIKKAVDKCGELPYNIIESRDAFRVAARKSCTAPGQVKVAGTHQMLGRASRPRQGDTASPRRGLNDFGDQQAFGRMPRLTASRKPLF